MTSPPQPSLWAGRPKVRRLFCARLWTVRSYTSVPAPSKAGRHLQSLRHRRSRDGAGPRPGGVARRRRGAGGVPVPEGSGSERLTLGFLILLFNVKNSETCLSPAVPKRLQSSGPAMLSRAREPNHNAAEFQGGNRVGGRILPEGIGPGMDAAGGPARPAPDPAQVPGLAHAGADTRGGGGVPGALGPGVAFVPGGAEGRGALSPRGPLFQPWRGLAPSAASFGAPPPRRARPSWPLPQGPG